MRLRDVELQFDIRKIGQYVEERLVQKAQFEELRVADEKRLKELYDRFEEIGSISCKNEIDMHNCVRTCTQVAGLSSTLEKEVGRVSAIIDDLRLGDNFREVINSLEPGKIISLDSTLQAVALQLGQLAEEQARSGLDLAKTTKELHELEVLFKAKQENLDPQVI